MMRGVLLAGVLSWAIIIENADAMQLVRDTPVEKGLLAARSAKGLVADAASAHGAAQALVEDGLDQAEARLAGATRKNPDKGPGGPGERDNRSKDEGSSWDYYMSGTGLILWLGPLLCVSLVACLAIGGKYYKNQTKRTAQFQRDKQVLSVPEIAQVRRDSQEQRLEKHQEQTLQGCDIPQLVALLDDSAPLTTPPQDPHPWASPPKTVGALAGTKIAALAAEDPYGCADLVHQAGGLPKIVAFLDQSEDRQHCALIALALIAYNDVCANDLVGDHVTDQLMKFKDVPNALQRSTVAIILRYVFFYSEQAKSSFLQKHGLTVFTDLLRESDPAIQLNAITNILDILFGAGGLDAEILQHLQAQPLRGELETRLKPMAENSKEEDVAENAAYLLETIGDQLA